MNTLMVCTGNYCRSQIAAAMYSHHINILNGHGGHIVSTAGTTNWGYGRVPAPKVMDIIKERTGLHWRYTPRLVAIEEVANAHRIYVMEFAHEEYFMRYYPEHVYKVKLLSELAGRREEIFNPHYDNDDQLQIAANIIGYYIAKGCGSILPPVQLTGDE